MTISLNVLNHLGIGLYSNVPAVLSEIVANAWDADAENVDIAIDAAKNEIVIKDDGVGMTADNINKRYLMVGYQKRLNEPPFTPVHKRRPMGRKGIGKLSVFSISDTVEVHSAKDGEVNGLIMRVSEIKDATEKGNGSYHPEVVSPETISIDKGTRIVLRDLKRNLSTTPTFLRRRLARRFSIMGEESQFRVVVNGESLSVRDRDFFPDIQFMWYIGKESEHYVDRCVNLVESVQLDSAVNGKGKYSVRGWLATVENHSKIDEQNNTIVVFARGKLIHEDLLAELKQGGLFTKYLIGELDADFMDQDELDDIVTSNRQRVNEEDPRYEMLKGFVQRALEKIRSDWEDFRNSHGTKKALENPVIDEWYKRLGKDNKAHAQKLFGRIYSLRGADEEARKELYKATILAFEKMAFKNSLSRLEAVESESDFKLLEEIFDGIDEIEAVHYHQIVRGRLEVIRRFEDLVDSPIPVKEKILQEYIFDHLWLLSPTWERAASNKRIEEAVTKEFGKITATLSEEERRGRIDIRYKTAAGKHVIVELKKYDRSVNIYDLLKQLAKYKSALLTCLSTKFPNEPQVIEGICILGLPPEGEPPQTVIGLLKEADARYVTYDSLIQEALDSYQDYLDADKKVSALLEILERL